MTSPLGLSGVRLLCVVLVMSGVALAGCGASGGSLSVAGFAAKGNTICRQAAADEGAIHASSMRAALPLIKPIAIRELNELRRLTPPASEHASYTELLEVFSRLNGLLPSLSSSLAHSQKPPSALLAHGHALAVRAASLARPLGLSGCGSGTS
jgi:hypothetical protein